MLSLLSFMAMLSLNLGLINLMPVPVLDGGHILIMALEGIARRDFSIQAKEKMLLAGFVVLMMLMVTVIYNDLTRISSARTPHALAQLRGSLLPHLFHRCPCGVDRPGNVSLGVGG